MKNTKTFKSIFFLVILTIAVACNNAGKKTEKAIDNSKVSSIEVSISGMTCTGCEQTIQTSIAKLEGIKSIKAFFTTGKAFVEYSPSLTDTARIRKAIADAGYIVNNFVPAVPIDSVK